MKRIIDWLFRKQFLDGVEYGILLERKMRENHAKNKNTKKHQKSKNER